MDAKNTLHAINLSYSRHQKLIFAPLHFQLIAGDILLVQGQNGAGKSSLLRLLTGLTTPSTGCILWCGELIHHLHMQYWQDLHYVGHMHGIKLGLTVTENLQLAHYFSSSSIFSFDMLLQQLQLKTHKDICAKYLSAGQKRRLALAKLFMFPKPLWLLDEPLTALDTSTQTFFLSQLEAHAKRGGITVMSSHQATQIKMLATQTLDLSPSSITC